MNELADFIASLSDDARTVARVALILLLAWLLRALAIRLIRAFRAYSERRAGGSDHLARVDTLARVFRYAASVVIVLVAGSLVLNELGISVVPILATAGVAGLAIAFGAQSLLKDFFTGFFLLLEDQIRAGEVVDLNGKTGVVEEVTLRYVRMRDGEGRVIFVPNSEIRLVVNQTRDYAYAMADAAVSAEQDVEAALAVMREVAAGMRQDTQYGPAILDDVEVFGVERWELWGLLLRCRLRVRAYERDNVRRELMRRLLSAFKAKGIKTP